MSIWKHAYLKKQFEFNQFLNLNEGFTPIEQYELRGKKINIKREDLNPTGSWKDRATAYKISQLKHEEVKQAVISSSGNAAISFLKYANELYPELTLHIVVSQNTASDSKIAIIESMLGDKHKIHFAENMKMKRAEIVKNFKAANLSSSLDNNVTKAYWSLGIEIGTHLQKRLGKKDVIYVAASSGTALVGMAQGLSFKLSEQQMPQIIVCQTNRVHPIASEYSSENLIDSHESLADSIIDKTCLRMPQIINILKNTNGKAMSISDQELQIANEIISNYAQNISYTSLLPFAGLLRNIDTISDFDNIYCIFSGR